MWTVELDPIRGWLLSLDQRSYEQVMADLELLAEHGPQLGPPLWTR